MEELIRLINDLKANRVEKEYIENIKSRLKSFREQLSEVEVRIADLEKELRDLEDEKTEDLQVFSPFINSPKQVSFQLEKQSQLSSCLDQKRELDDSISYLQSQLEEHTYVFDYIVSVQKNTEALINQIIDVNSDEASSNSDSSDSDSSNSDSIPGDDSIRAKLEMISQIMVSDPMRAKVQLEDLIRDL